MPKDIYKYNLSVDNGQISELWEEIREVLFKNKDNQQMLKSLLGKNYIFLNNSFYSTQMVDDQEFTLQSGAKLVVHYDVKSQTNQDVKQNLVGRLVKIILKKLRLKTIGRKLFNIKDSITMQNDLEIWPGFSVSLVQTLNKSLSMLNVDFVHKVITQKNVLRVMESIKDNFSNNFEEMIK